MQKDGKVDKSKEQKEFSLSSIFGFGELLLIMSLAMDGFTGAIQDKMNAGHKPDPHSMMLNMNVWSCLYLFIGKQILLRKIDYQLFFFLSFSSIKKSHNCH